MKFFLPILVFVTLPFILLAQSDTCLITTELGVSFPPVQDENQRSFTEIRLNELGVKKIRFAENWSFREPTQGNFNWNPLDKRINWADANDYEVLLTIQSNGPNWACSGIQNPQSCVFNDNNDFKNYIEQLLQRYPGQIAKIQFGNEWQSSFWYAGNALAFIEANNILFNAVQTYSPNTEVVLGGFTTISLRYLAGCNGFVDSFYDDDGVLYDSTFLVNNCNIPAVQNVVNRIDSVLQFANYDMIDLHFYDDVEQWDEYYLNFSDTISKPIIVSEFGGPNMNYEAYSDAFHAGRLYQYIKKLDSLQISEAYYFKLVEGTANLAHSNSGLIDDSTLIEKPAYYVFKNFIACTASIQGFLLNNQLNIYPNPASKSVTIDFSKTHLESINKIHIHDSFGRNMLSVKSGFDSKTIINLADLSTGIYFLVIENLKGESIIRKLIISD